MNWKFLYFVTFVPPFKKVGPNSPFALELGCAVRVCYLVRLRGTSLLFSFLLPWSSHKILWQAILLMFRSSDNIRKVIWWFCCNVSRTLSMFLGLRVVDGRPDLTSFSVVSNPHENAYAIQTRVHVITLHHRKLALWSCFSGTFTRLHKKLISIFARPLARLNCPRKLDT